MALGPNLACNLFCAVLSRVLPFVTPWTVAHQAPLSMGFSKQDYWSGLPFFSPENLLDPGMEPRSLALQVDSLLSEPPGKPPMGFQVPLKELLPRMLPPPQSIHIL